MRNYDSNFQKMRVFDMHNDFTLFWRVVPSGKKVVYYHAYDENVRRRGPWTTGQTSKTRDLSIVFSNFF
jgi:hypothetical protein